MRLCLDILMCNVKSRVTFNGAFTLNLGHFSCLFDKKFLHIFSIFRHLAAKCYLNVATIRSEDQFNLKT